VNQLSIKNLKGWSFLDTKFIPLMSYREANDLPRSPNGSESFLFAEKGSFSNVSETLHSAHLDFSKLSETLTPRNEGHRRQTSRPPLGVGSGKMTCAKPEFAVTRALQEDLFAGRKPQGRRSSLAIGMLPCPRSE